MPVCEVALLWLKSDIGELREIDRNHCCDVRHIDSILSLFDSGLALLT